MNFETLEIERYCQCERNAQLSGDDELNSKTKVLVRSKSVVCPLRLVVVAVQQRVHLYRLINHTQRAIEPYESVTREARNDVEVKVEHVLTAMRAVVLTNRYTIGRAHGFHCGRDVKRGRWQSDRS